MNYYFLPPHQPLGVELTPLQKRAQWLHGKGMKLKLKLRRRHDELPEPEFEPEPEPEPEKEREREQKQQEPRMRRGRKQHRTDEDGQSKQDGIQYEKARKLYDEMLPTNTEEDTQRLYDFVNDLRKPKHELKHGLDLDLPYDVNNCPEFPPRDYPYEWPILDVLENWNPNDTFLTRRPGIHQGLCRFDFETEMHKAQRYREAELPFMMRDDPQVLKVVERWNQPGYLSQMLGKDTEYRTEYSETNSLMFYREQRGKRPDNWEPPMRNVEMTYDEWVEKASQPVEDMAHDKPHWYFRANAKATKSDNEHFLFQELPFFTPEENFYIVDGRDTRGINCRFGMMGNTAATHFDGSRNFIMLFGGERRYVLSHPQNCPNLALYPRNHPSGRHSALNWSDPDLESYPEFAKATGNEVVLQAGDVLYLPTQWFHFIVSLDMNWQCNARSGITDTYQDHVRRCGF